MEKFNLKVKIDCLKELHFCPILEVKKKVCEHKLYKVHESYLDPFSIKLSVSFVKTQ